MKYSLFDAHCDTLCKLCDFGEDANINSYNIDISRMSKYEKYTQVFACFVAPEYAECAYERYSALIDTYNRHQLEGILSIEGGEGITSLEALDKLYNMGVRIIALTWNGTNHLAGGADDAGGRGITDFGKKVLCEMDIKGIFADVSHLNDASFYDLADIWQKPILATHSNSRHICNHRRNLTDDMFNIIKNSNGCVGINFYPPFLNEDGVADIDDIVRHIEHFMSLGGEDNIGIGADFDGTDSLPLGIRGCEDTYKVFDRLLQLNYSQAVVEKISHKNFERIFTNV